MIELARSEPGIPIEPAALDVVDRRAGCYDVVDGEELVFIKEGDIMAVLEDQADPADVASTT